MSSRGIRRMRVIVVGLTGSQYTAMHKGAGPALPMHRVLPAEALRHQGALPGLVAVTRFVKQKAYDRLQKMLGRARLYVRLRGTAASVVKVLQGVVHSGNASLPSR